MDNNIIAGQLNVDSIKVNSLDLSNLKASGGERSVCEARILEKLLEIRDIMMEYDSSSTYLNLTILDNMLSVNNNYWEYNVDKQINFFTTLNSARKMRNRNDRYKGWKNE